MKKSKGFTLVELMIAVAIIAALASIAIPAFSHYIVEAEGSKVKANLEISYRENRANEILLESRGSSGK